MSHYLSVAIDGKQKHLSVKATVSRIPRIKTLPICRRAVFRHDDRRSTSWWRSRPVLMTPNTCCRLAMTAASTQAAMPCNVHKGTVSEVYRVADKVTLNDSLWSLVNPQLNKTWSSAAPAYRRLRFVIRMPLLGREGISDRLKLKSCCGKV